MRRGAMDPVGSHKLNRSRDDIDKNLEPNDILGKLISYDVIDDDDVDVIRNTTPLTRRTRVTEFIKIIKNRGPDAYPMFIKALRDCEYVFLADMIESTPCSPVQETPPNPKEEFQKIISGISEEIRKKTVTPKVLVRVSGAVGIGWEFIALGLGLSQVQIDQVKLQYNVQGVPTQFYRCLEKWRTSTLNSKIGNLFDVLIDYSDSVTIDWKVLKEALIEAQQG